MSDIAIKFENISKQYRLGLVSTKTLSHDLNRWWQTTVLRKDDPYLRIGETNDRSQKGNSEYVWALKDISFDVKQGEVLGIIGKNGAGKSTLLKLLSRVTNPTTGSIKAKGRIASLLEVGTGFHPELTGRENIYMNGSIMGMTRYEIDRKLEEIVEFAGVARYIDTPTKRYSSGMTVRLGFSIAAHLEPEILVVDEVLAVGDIEFQKKAIGKMQDVSKGEGRTVLFVSHNMGAINNLCNKACILTNGMVSFEGDVAKGIQLYLKGQEKNKKTEIGLIKDELFELINISLLGGDSDHTVRTDQPLNIVFNYLIKKDCIGLRIGFDLVDNQSGIVVFRSFHDENEKPTYTMPGKYESTAIIPPHLLKNGSYSLSIVIGLHSVRWITYNEITLDFTVVNVNGINSHYSDERPGIIMPRINWNNKSI